MEPLEQKLERLIRENFNRGWADLETFPTGRVAGHVISSDFEDRSFAERRQMIWDVLDQHLSQEEALQVSMLLTYTPEEWEIPLEADES